LQPCSQAGVIVNCDTRAASPPPTAPSAPPG
jgi:hypothetical protein